MGSINASLEESKLENENINNNIESFNNDLYVEQLNMIETDKSEQRTIDNKKESELKEILFANNSSDINNFIEKEKKEGTEGVELLLKLISSGYTESQILSSSLDENIKDKFNIEKEKIIKKYFLPKFFRFKDEDDMNEQFLDIFRESQKSGDSYNTILKKCL